ncbi:MAG: hypothetical protein ACRDJ0_09915 [Actinomycetota bacterium]
MALIQSREEVDQAPIKLVLRRALSGLLWMLKLAAALFIFVGALQVMKTGAASLEVLQHGGPLVANSGSTLALGWLGALLVLSGSPIAASSLTLVSGGNLTVQEGFWMLNGSRLGAAFVVLFVGVIYALRGGSGKRAKPVATGVIAVVVTAVVYIPGSLVGAFLLNGDALSSVNPRLPLQVSSLLEIAYGGLLNLVEQLPGVIAFVGGLILLLVALKMIDGVIPELNSSDFQGNRAGWLKNKWAMFGLGAIVALVTMSVSVALTVLVPLVARNYLRREDIIPYVMGANITTLGDTLLAALLLDSVDAVHAVTASLLGTTVVSLLLLTFLYSPLRTFVKGICTICLRSRTSLATFTAALFIVPLALLAGSRLI